MLNEKDLKYLVDCIGFMLERRGYRATRKNLKIMAWELCKLYNVSYLTQLLPGNLDSVLQYIYDWEASWPTHRRLTYFEVIDGGKKTRI